MPHTLSDFWFAFADLAGPSAAGGSVAAGAVSAQEADLFPAGARHLLMKTLYSLREQGHLTRSQVGKIKRLALSDSALDALHACIVLELVPEETAQELLDFLE